MNRRHFLGTLPAAALVGASTTPGPFLDAHAHVSSERVVAHLDGLMSRPAGKQKPVDAAELIRRMDADGVRKALVLSTAYQMAADFGPAEKRGTEIEEYARLRGENDFAAAACAKFPGRLVPFLSVNPKRGYAVDEIDRCVEKHRMRGLKLHLWNSMVDTRQPGQLSQLRRVAAYAASRGLPVVAHIFVGDVAGYGPADTERFVHEVIAPHAGLRISIAHLAGAGGFAVPAQQCLERLVELCGPGSAMADRVWVDLAAIGRQTPPPEPVKQKLGELLERWTPSRMLWGSDGIPEALAQMHAAWPLSDAAWDVVRQNTGDSFLSGKTKSPPA